MQSTPEVVSRNYLSKLYTMTLSYQLGNSLMLTMIPYIANDLNASNREYGLAFTFYYITQFISSIVLGKVSDRYGRRVSLSIANIGLTLFTLCQLFTEKVWVYLLLRALTGLFDAPTALLQACICDVTTSKNRAHYISQLESVNNIAQIIGPIMGGILSTRSLDYAMYCIATVLFYSVASFVTVLFLDESNPAVLERQQVLSNLQAQNLDPQTYEERKKQLLLQLEVQHSVSKSKSTAPNSNNKNSTFPSSPLPSLTTSVATSAPTSTSTPTPTSAPISTSTTATSTGNGIIGNSTNANKANRVNFVIAFALIAEFCSRWIINIFDVSFAEYSEEVFKLSSLEFSLSSGIGSIFNVFQTGWLFNALLKHNVSIPTITSLAGISGIIGIVMCISAKDKFVVWMSSLFFTIAYGFAAPTAPTVLSAEFDAAHQGMATSLVLIGGQSAYITAPTILGELYGIDSRLPFLVSLAPCLLVTILMVILNFIPGGKTAGQVPLRFALENLAKETKMECIDNEMEMDAIAHAGDDDDGFANTTNIPSSSSLHSTQLDKLRKGKDNENENGEEEDEDGEDSYHHTYHSHHQVEIEMIPTTLFDKKWMDNEDEHEDEHEEMDNENDQEKRSKHSHSHPSMPIHIPILPTPHSLMELDDQDDEVNARLHTHLTSRQSNTENARYIHSPFGTLRSLSLSRQSHSSETNDSEDEGSRRRSGSNQDIENGHWSDEDEIAI